MNEVDKYIVNFKNYFVNNPNQHEVFFNNVLFNEFIFYKNLKICSQQKLEVKGTPVLTQNELETVIMQSKMETVTKILNELSSTNLFYKTRVIDTNEELFGVTPHGTLIAELLTNECKKN